ncbi:ubiquinol-cytochrome C chaperone family protein [Methylocella sp.]|uniref:ubiquinol-cytochrome C chaperone family protein n=1 Tax=Methylocella sp. TaxID=1978226 RepID=UPI003784BD13
MLAKLISWFSGDAANRRAVERLYAAVVERARTPSLYLDYGAPDTLDGRFELLALHAFLVLRRLNAMPAPAPELAQDLVNAVFAHFDGALREMGVGDPSVPKRMKTLAEAFLGRSLAYEATLRDGGLEEALKRNVYGGGGDAGRLARYVERAEASLAGAPLEAFLAGRPPFPDPLEVER